MEKEGGKHDKTVELQENYRNTDGKREKEGGKHKTRKCKYRRKQKKTHGEEGKKVKHIRQESGITGKL